MTNGDADTVIAVLLAEDLAADSPPRRLTRAEAAKVRSLIVDEGMTRIEALAWVRDFGASDEWQPCAQVAS